MSEIIPAKDLRAMFGPVRDQGGRPTCLAFAASDAHAALRPDWVPLSCDYAFYHAQKRAGLPPTVGCRPSAMCETLRTDGQPAETAWPYIATLPALLATWTPPTSVGQLYGRNSQAADIKIDDIIASLDKDRPVLICCRMSESFYRPDANGVVDPAPGEIAWPKIGHALVAVGHGSTGSQRIVLVRNSWGPRWGLGGYGWLTEAFLTPRLYSVAILTENVNVSANPATA